MDFASSARAAEKKIRWKWIVVPRRPSNIRYRTAQQTRSVIVTFSIGFKLVTLNLTFGKRSANVYVLCRHIFDV